MAGKLAKESEVPKAIESYPGRRALRHKIFKKNLDRYSFETKNLIQ